MCEKTGVLTVSKRVFHMFLQVLANVNDNANTKPDQTTTTKVSRCVTKTDVLTVSKRVFHMFLQVPAKVNENANTKPDQTTTKVSRCVKKPEIYTPRILYLYFTGVKTTKGHWRHRQGPSPSKKTPEPSPSRGRPVSSSTEKPVDKREDGPQVVRSFSGRNLVKGIFKDK